MSDNILIPDATNDNDRIIQINIEEQMKTSYIDYSMSVIVGRALPDVRDGLKPVHRRILYAMNDIGMLHNKPYKKSARIVGEVLGKYHPHGDSAVYDSLVRMAQDWSMRYTLIDGQGNFGNQDGDSPAAMRYTEARLRNLAEHILIDIEKETVDFQLNFDDSIKEPTVLPARIPQLLVNGSSGIAVGMATNMLPHNLNEVIEGCLAYIANKEITIEEIMKYIKAPDLPTGGIIYGMEGVRQGMLTGRGRVVIRGKYTIETKGNREQIVITEVPYQVNRDTLTDKIGQLVNEKIIEGISNVNNESNKREGTRIVIELKKDAVSSFIVNQLFKLTELQTSFGINNIALSKGRPRLLNIKDLIVEFIDFRMEIVIRRSAFELRKAQERAHILNGYLIALDHLNEVIELIKQSQTPDEAKTKLMNAGWGLDDIQCKAILELRLQRLTGMEIEKIKEEFNELQKQIAYLQMLLSNEVERYKIIGQELIEIRDKFGDERKSEIQYLAEEISIEDLIPDETVVITISHLGYIKRTSLSEYRQQKRGGRGSIGSKTREEDFVKHLFISSTHHTMLIFTQKGRCYWLKVYEIPEGEKGTKGRPVQNMIELPSDDSIKTVIDIKNFKDEEFVKQHYIVLCTKKGIIKKTDLIDLSHPRSTGINVISIAENDELLSARLTNGNCEIMMAVKSGNAIRFHEELVRSTGRGGQGVIGIRIQPEDEVIGMICVDKEDKSRTVLVISEKGFGKRTPLDDENGDAIYRITNRGGQGVKTMNITEKTGNLIGLLDVHEEEDLMITCESGMTLRTSIKDIRLVGRSAQGVIVIRLGTDDKIAAISNIEESYTINKEEEINTNNAPVTDTPPTNE